MAKKKVDINLLKEGEEYVSIFFRSATGLDIFYPLKDKGWFSPKRNPAPFMDEKQGLYRIPYWPVLDYLERVAEESTSQENRHYAEELMQILREVTRPPNGEKVDNFKTWHAFSKIITALPTDVIKLEDIELIADWLDTQFTVISLVGYEIGDKFLLKLLKSNEQREVELAIRVIDVLSRIKWVDQKEGEYGTQKEPVTSIEPYWLKEIFQSNGHAIGYKCGIIVLNMLRSRLTDVINENNLDRLSHIWRPSIEDPPKGCSWDNDVKNVLLSALRDALLGYAEKNSQEARDYVRQLFTDELQIFVRLAIYATDVRFDIFGELFQQVFKSSMLDIRLIQELHSLLSHHFDELPLENKTRVIEAIERLSEIWIHNREETEASNANLRLRWLSALKETKDERVHELYEKYMAITKHEPD